MRLGVVRNIRLRREIELEPVRTAEKEIVAPKRLDLETAMLNERFRFANPNGRIVGESSKTLRFQVLRENFRKAAKILGGVVKASFRVGRRFFARGRRVV